MPKDIAPEKIPVVLLYNVDPEWTPSERNEVVKLSSELCDALRQTGYPTVLVAIEDDNIAGHLRPFNPDKYLIFNWCEGLPGVKHSEWLVARKLEELGYTFTGADSGALLLSQDKQRVKIMLDEASIPTPAWRIFSSPDVQDWQLFPAIVKPQNEHCSAGIASESVVTNRQDLENRISFILDQYSQRHWWKILLMAVSFMSPFGEMKKLRFLPAAEMDFSCFGNLQDRLCSYEAKFTPGSKHYEDIKTLLPAPLTDDEKRAMEKVCCDAYWVMGCRDYAVWTSDCETISFTSWMSTPMRISAQMPVWPVRRKPTA